MAATATKSPIATVNPFTNEVVRKFEPMGPDAVDAAVDDAHGAFAHWSRTQAEERAEVVHRAALLLRERGEEIARTLTLEMGKLIRHSRVEVDLGARILEHYAERGPELVADEPLELEGGEAVVVNEPLGVLLGVEPWNFPVYQVVRLAAPNLVLGNTILLKHASITPQSAIALEQLFADAGAPAGVYTNLLITPRDVGRVIDNPLVQAASLTGSDRAGSSVGEIAGRNVKKTVLELGGNDPFVVLDRDNLDRTLEAAMVGRMHNMGQVCTSAKRMIVLPEAYDDFVTGLADRLRALEPGDPADERTEIAPLSSERAAEQLLEQVQDAIGKGATAVVGGGRIDRSGAFFEPTLLTGVTPDMRAYREELFGPVAVVYEAQGDSQAVALANDSPYGLGGAVFAADVERARAVAGRIESGMVWINHPTASEPQLPFGGIKRSGYGRELSHIGAKEFANRKLIVTMPADAPITDALG
jgi:succinate-semialdehyde dehydrogenase / glutarate-semialdehyde dehydrogenase